MNARQKCKKLKKELEAIENLPLMKVHKIKEIDVTTEHLKANICFPIDALTDGGTFADDAARRQLTKSLAEVIRNKIVVNKEDLRESGLRVIKYSTDIFVGFGEGRE